MKLEKSFDECGVMLTVLINFKKRHISKEIEAVY